MGGGGGRGTPFWPEKLHFLVFSDFSWFLLKMSEKLGNVRKSTGISHFLLFWVELTPPETLKNHWNYNGFGEGPRQDATFHQKGDFWCPGGCFLVIFMKKPWFPHFSPLLVKGAPFRPPPTQNLAMVMLFQWFCGGTVSPKSRNNAFSSYFPIFSLFFMFFMKICENSEKTPKSTNFLRLGRRMPPGIHWKRQ